MPNTTQDTLQRIAEAQKNPIADADLTRAYSQSSSATSGLTFYDLESPAKLLYPVLTPLRNRIPRVVGGRGIQANWRAITAINPSKVTGGVSEGNRGAVIDQTTADYLAKFAGIGHENYVTFEADYAAEGYDDAKARAVQGLLHSTMITEELLDLGGNASLALSAAATPTLADVATGGALAAATAYKVYCVPLTLRGQRTWSVAGTGNPVAVTRTNADGSTDTIKGFCGQMSSVASVTTASDGNATHGVRASVTPIAGAAAYAWFWGTATGAGSTLGAITAINSVLITANATGSMAANATGLDSDNSKDSLVYDGLISQIATSGSGAYVAALATGTAGVGTKLTSDGAGGITQVETAFASFWDNYRLSPDTIYVSSQVLLDMNALIIANGGAPLIRYASDNGGNTLDAGTVVGSYLNKITNQRVAIKVHPNMPAGMMIFYSDSIPYPLSNVGSVLVKKLRRDYYQIEWPLKSRKYEYGVYFDGVLQCYFPPAFGMIHNIAAGH